MVSPLSANRFERRLTTTAIGNLLLKPVLACVRRQDHCEMALGVVDVGKVREEVEKDNAVHEGDAQQTRLT